MQITGAVAAPAHQYPVVQATPAAVIEPAGQNAPGALVHGPSQADDTKLDEEPNLPAGQGVHTLALQYWPLLAEQGHGAASHTSHTRDRRRRRRRRAKERGCANILAKKEGAEGGLRGCQGK